jgi:DNA-directed RNA polymerase specialized sigma24 family protein
MREALETEGRLSPAEVQQELENMTAADWVRVERLASWLFDGVSAVSHEDLLQEACVKFLSGERVWHRGFAAVPAFTSVLESMASNYRKREKNGPIDTGTLVRSADMLDESEFLIRHVDAVETITPETAVSDGQQLARLESRLSDDDEAALIAVVWAEGRRGADAAEALGMNEHQYEAARKRLVRKLEPTEDERRKG